MTGCSQPSPTATGITLTLADIVLIGKPAQATASVQLSDGTTETTGITFTIDKTAIASVNGSGLVSGASAGYATLTATAHGFSATRALRVLPDLNGSWTGVYRTTRCDLGGDYNPACCIMSCQYELQLRDVKMTGDQVTAIFDSGSILPTTVTGTIAENGALTLAGAEPQCAGCYRKEIRNWRTTSPGVNTMTGTFETLYVGRVGPNAVKFDEFISLSRTSQ